MQVGTPLIESLGMNVLTVGSRGASFSSDVLAASGFHVGVVSSSPTAPSRQGANIASLVMANHGPSTPTMG